LSSENNSHKSESHSSVLCVDLDKTLVVHDTLIELFLCYLKINFPGALLLSIQIFFKGRLWFKKELVRTFFLETKRHKKDIQSFFSVENSILNQRVLDIMKEYKRRGGRLLLTTASDMRIAKLFYDKVGLFDAVAASEAIINLKGSVKRDYLIQRYGEKGFDYIGDSKADMPVFLSAYKSYFVGSSYALYRKLQMTVPDIVNLSELKAADNQVFLQWFRSIRVYQWVKNLLLFVPVTFAHKLLDIGYIINPIIGTIAFCLTASSVYIINDLLDLQADRVHPEKKNRPLAKGEISLNASVIGAFFLLLSGIIFSFLLPSAFILYLFLYFILTSCYTFYCKLIPIVDIIILSFLYCLRILAGGAAAEVPVSPWLLACSLFVFYSLASAKRYAELFKKSGTLVQEKIVGRGYTPNDSTPIGIFGIASGLISVLIFVQYIQSSEVLKLYRNPSLLLLAAPLLLYWISRIWLFAYRGVLSEDPIVFAMTDKASYIVGVLLFLIFFSAM
jgi:4-hydroxybenzoate polyprenyltransferase/phosphoserine phosphatase